MKTISNITIGEISDVKKSGDEEGVYFATVQISPAEGFPFEDSFYCARADDYAMTGRWIYQQIVEGNIIGTITQLAAGVDPMTGNPYPPQPTSTGTQTL